MTFKNEELARYMYRPLVLNIIVIFNNFNYNLAYNLRDTAKEIGRHGMWRHRQMAENGFAPPP